MPTTQARGDRADAEPARPDIYRPEVGDDPYPTYRVLREHFPVLHDDTRHADLYAHVQMGRGDRYVLSRYDDIHMVLQDHDRFSSQRRGSLPDGPQPSREEWRGNLIGDDPPRHTVIRKMVSTAMTPRAVRALGPAIRATAATMIDAFGDGEPVDLAKALAVPLPVWLIAYMLGVPEGDMAEFRKWAFASNAQHWKIWWEEARGALPEGEDGARTLEETRLAALQDFYAYFDAAVRERAQRPLDDLVSRLVKGQQQIGDEYFSRQELLQVIHLLLLGGNETTANLITLIFNYLADQPALWDRLRADRTLVDPVIEETMRWDSPVQSIGRRVVEPFELHGVHIPAESTLMLLLGSANRDESRFPDAETFSLQRRPNHHIGFGHGVHFCVGAPVTRLEVNIVLNLLLDRYRSVERAGQAKLAGSAPYGILSESRRLRGYGHLPLTFRR